MPRFVRKSHAAVFIVAALLASMPLAGPASAGSVSDPQIIDAHEQEVDNPEGGAEHVEEIVPIGAITARCGDGDGCRLRLFQGSADGLAVGLLAQLFSVEASGGVWTIHGVDGTPLGNMTTGGDSGDLAKGSILVFNSGAEICEFYESGVTNDYRLSSQATSLSPAFRCRLRIDD